MEEYFHNQENLFKIDSNLRFLQPQYPVPAGIGLGNKGGIIDILAIDIKDFTPVLVECQTSPDIFQAYEALKGYVNGWNSLMKMKARGYVVFPVKDEYTAIPYPYVVAERVRERLRIATGLEHFPEKRTLLINPLKLQDAITHYECKCMAVEYGNPEEPRFLVQPEDTKVFRKMIEDKLVELLYYFAETNGITTLSPEDNMTIQTYFEEIGIRGIFMNIQFLSPIRLPQEIRKIEDDVNYVLESLNSFVLRIKRLREKLAYEKRKEE